MAPCDDRRTPEDFGIPEIRFSDVQHWVAFELRPRATSIVAERDVLRLKSRTVTRVNCDHRRFAIDSESTCVFLVNHRAAGKCHDSIFIVQSDRQMLPMYKIQADGMAPAHLESFRRQSETPDDFE